MSTKRDVSFSNPQKVYFPSGFTKGDMIKYYIEIAPTMVPHLRDRPITLIRFPDGVKGESFYEKNAPGHRPDWMETFGVPRRENAGEINYILVNNAETLAWCANLGAIEFHPFLHRVPVLDRPTHVAFDLDPGEGSDILTCVEVAHLLRGVLDQLGLKSFPKVSGSKGVQVYVPLNEEATYDATTPFAKSIAQILAQQHPKLIVSEMPKALRKGRVMIDWSQNVQAKTTVAVYSMRGKRDEPFISAPVTWAELSRAAKLKEPQKLYFSPDDVLKRVKKSGDLFAEVLTLEQALPEAFMKLGPSTSSRGSLARYAEKRDFTKTAEPGPVLPRRSSQGSTRRFVIQKHAASRLHFDFRLEMGGTLKSWAVPKGLPYELGVKRAAIEVEDHPLDYIDFEGTIPKGQYGGGTVMVWDIGTYDIISGNYHGGDLKLWLDGKKLKGEWHIFRIKSEKSKPVWLIAKAGKPLPPLSAKEEDSSILTKRSLAQIGADNDKQWQSNQGSAHELREVAKEKSSLPVVAKAPKRKLKSAGPDGEPPRFVEPMKPRLVDVLPEGPEWSYEVKWDGYRAMLLKHGDQVQLLSRNEKSLAKDFPGIVRAAGDLATTSFLIDGEVVALDAEGKPAFQELQNRTSTKAVIVFYAFDLLSFEGKDLRETPLSERKSLLGSVLAQDTQIRLSSDLPGTAEEVVHAVKKLGLEGVVAKRLDSTYLPGDLSMAWQKLRLRRGQEFVVGGYRPGMKPFESVLVGYYVGEQLVFAGKVRPGFTARSRQQVWQMIKGDEMAACPFANLPDTDTKGRWGEGITAAEMKTLRWVKPKVVVQVDFVEWTSNSHLRHAAFAGVRTDKKPTDVKRETPGSIDTED